MKIKREVRVYLDGGKLVDIIKKLEKAVEKYGEEAWLSIEEDYKYGESFTYVHVVYEEDETPEEEVKRRVREAAIEGRKLEAGRKAYEELKKKFETAQ